MLKVLLCGGGNAIHVLSSYVSAKPDTHVTILSLFPGEADRLRDAIPKEGIRCMNDLGDDVLGTPDAVIDKVSIYQSDIGTICVHYICIICLWTFVSFLYNLYSKG